MVVEIVAESLHLLLVATFEVNVRNLVEAYEIDAAEESLGQLHNLAGVSHRVVNATEHDIFERETALMSEVVLVHEVDNLGYRHSALGRHEHGALFGYGRVHADSNMAFALVEESLQLVLHTNAAYGDALGAPSVAIV